MAKDKATASSIDRSTGHNSPHWPETRQFYSVSHIPPPCRFPYLRIFRSAVSPVRSPANRSAGDWSRKATPPSSISSNR